VTIDQAGIEFIKEFEGCVLHVYNDVAGKPTIGIGHLIRPDEDFSAGITQEQAESLLFDDMERFENAVNNLAPNCNQNQFNALCSFAFNLGTGSLATMLAHGWDEVPQQILYWDHSGGVKVKGLTRRREAESALFTS